MTNTKLLIIIIMSLLLIGAIIVVFFSKTQKDISQYCKSDKDCNADQHCIFDPDYNNYRCTNKDENYCNTKDKENLVKCDLSDNSPCDKCTNQPPLKCISPNDPDISVGNIPGVENGKGWCLPPITSDVSCNPITSQKILVKDRDGNYSWKCSCRSEYSKILQQIDDKSSCDIVTACGSLYDRGDLYVQHRDSDNKTTKCDTVSDCSGIVNSKCMENIDNTQKSCHVKWNSTQEYKTSLDPLEGVCNCDSGQYAPLNPKDDKSVKRCVTNTCAPYLPNTQECAKAGDNSPAGCCDCGNTEDNYNNKTDQYIDCWTTAASRYNGAQSDVAPYITFCEDNPVCLKDPCAGDDNSGFWKPSDLGGQCICREDRVSLRDKDLITGETCIDPCIGNGSCEQRGTCYVDGSKNEWECDLSENRCKDENGQIYKNLFCNNSAECKTSCKDCTTDWSQDASKQCAGIKKQDCLNNANSCYYNRCCRENEDGKFPWCCRQTTISYYSGDGGPSFPVSTYFCSETDKSGSVDNGMISITTTCKNDGKSASEW